MDSTRSAPSFCSPVCTAVADITRIAPYVIGHSGCPLLYEKCVQICRSVDISSDNSGAFGQLLLWLSMSIFLFRSHKSFFIPLGT